MVTHIRDEKLDVLQSNSLTTTRALSIVQSLAATDGVADPQPASLQRDHHYIKVIVCYPGLSGRRSHLPPCSRPSARTAFLKSCGAQGHGDFPCD